MLSTISQILHNNDMYAINAQKIMDLEQFMLDNEKKEYIMQHTTIPTVPTVPTIPIQNIYEKPILHSKPQNQVLPQQNTYIVDVKDKVPTTPTQPEVHNTIKPEIITPTQSNTLFWSTFIGVYGYGEYMKIGSKYNNAEIEEKQHIMEELSKTPKKLKETNQTITNAMVQELFSSLMVNKCDQLFSLVAFSVYYNRAIYVLFSNKSYLVFEPNKHTQNTNAIIIHAKVGARSNIYSIEFEHEKDRLDFIRTNYVLLESYNKPLKGLSSYKVADLEKMATILGLDTSMKKGDLYNKIAEICSLEKVMINSK
jgi:hypothetical protein